MYGEKYFDVYSSGNNEKPILLERLTEHNDLSWYLDPSRKYIF